MRAAREVRWGAIARLLPAEAVRCAMRRDRAFAAGGGRALCAAAASRVVRALVEAAPRRSRRLRYPAIS